MDSIMSSVVGQDWAELGWSANLILMPFAALAMRLFIQALIPWSVKSKKKVGGKSFGEISILSNFPTLFVLVIVLPFTPWNAGLSVIMSIAFFLPEIAAVLDQTSKKGKDAQWTKNKQSSNYNSHF